MNVNTLFRLLATLVTLWTPFSYGQGMSELIENGDLKKLEELLKKNSDSNLKDAKGNPLLYLALVNQQIEAAILLLHYGADPNSTNSYGAPAIITAAGSGFDVIVDLLIKKGANINVRFEEYDSVTALMLAAQDGHERTVDILLKNGADVKAATVNGDTALIAACTKGNVSIINNLLKHGADINARTQSGYSALFVAISEGNGSLVDFLLKNGALFNVSDSNGDTPLMLAKRIKSPEIINLLVKAGAK